MRGGALLPFGGAKGSALALMVEVMCAALVGGSLSAEMDLSRHPGAHTPRTGQTVILIEPRTGGAGVRAFSESVDALVAHVRAAGAGRLPGEARLTARAACARDGLRLPAATVVMLRGLGAVLG